MESISGHTKVLYDLLKARSHTIGCEVGVHTGTTTAALLELLPGIKVYHAIDPWKSYMKYDGTKYRKPGHKKIKTWSGAKNHFIKITKPFKERVVIHQMTSVEAVKEVDDESLDWIFIDANHEYEYIKENLDLWCPKVKYGGLMAGHDYGGKWRGIKKAVDEFVAHDKLNVNRDAFVWWYIK